ncbi:hypothetical protein GA0061099_1008132 [Bradyrhizobium yuanmingense]|uniref:Uncharacterized protein n=1 Tax=Bradyrhizobium yuanmingense TaxID=108015 RepID=A0A1C3WZF4_9BRAD|nr:hypothetical protein [Bradyrhizobium yuanmingense]TWI21459.1 hypothetical protein IQ15_06113 [Bradyrhizobium yuanmingense]SCB45378.1 hypothetical protein GA0061099_1008132 [Bradyrhizobium yuanmingense]
MSIESKSPFDKEPAEGSRDIIDCELQRGDEADKVDHLPGVKVSGQPRGGAVDRARKERERRDEE